MKSHLYLVVLLTLLFLILSSRALNEIVGRQFPTLVDVDLFPTLQGVGAQALVFAVASAFILFMRDQPKLKSEESPEPKTK